MLNAILMPNRDKRFFFFDDGWADGEQTASMRDDIGNSSHILFNKSGAVIKGFVYDSPTGKFAMLAKEAWPGIFEGLPEEFKGILESRAFGGQEASFCIWRKPADEKWRMGNFEYPSCDGSDPDGMRYLLPFFNGNPNAWKGWAKSYYDIDIPVDAIKAVFGHAPIESSLVTLINSDLSPSELVCDIVEIGY